MKLPISWLREYVDFDDTPQGLADKLTFSGTEVAGIETVGSAFTGIVVGEILKVERHPNADKLTLCTVATGAGELTVVCGAPNAAPGLKVPFAPAGVTLPNGLKLKAAKIRGVESHGMLCAEDELGLSDDHTGLMILDAAWAAGTPLAEVLGPPETVLELEVTPNRPDCLSVLGIAREVAALYGVPLRRPEVSLEESDPPVESLAKVTVEDAEGCPRYTASVLTGVRLGPSPAWMRRRLELCGIRPINNIVDITNYVLLECGHPLHAFDLQHLAEQHIVVRRARADERMATLDDIDRALTPDMLVISDAQRAVAVAGVMGGAGSEIGDRTDAVLLEAAAFQPRSVRATSRALGLSTESSYRFERGVDPEGVEWASRRAAGLMQALAGARVARGLIDRYLAPPRPRTVACRFDRINRLLGLQASGAQMTQVFEALGLRVEAADAAGCTVRVPSWRMDLAAEVDLAEEFARLYGLDNIPVPESPLVRRVPGADDRPSRALFACRERLIGLGLREIMNYSLVSERLLNLFDPGDAARRISLPNPVSAEQTTLRTSLLPQMVETLGRNRARQVDEAALFEIGRVFFRGSEGGLEEEDRLAVGLLGAVGRLEGDRRRRPSAEESLLWIKGVWEALARAQGHRDVDVRRGEHPAFEVAADLLLNASPVGIVGLLRAELALEWRLAEPVAVLEVGLAPLLKAPATVVAVPPPAYPCIVRDIALIVDQAVTHADILAALKKNAPPELERIDLFDVFSGPSIGAGRKSMAYSLTFRSAARTLTDEEANRYTDRVKDALKQLAGIEIREG